MLLWLWLTTICVNAQSAGAMKELLTDPNVSLRCKEMLEERSEKIQIRQKLSALIERNLALVRGLSNSREQMKKRLEANYRLLKNEHYLATLQVQSREEMIIRNGCPGINLGN
jgi:predicted ArsR family transcriptional regulator